MIRSPKANKKATDLLGSPAFLLFNTAMDTTWRLFVPTISGTIIGVIIDNLSNTKPYATVAMITVGVLVSVVLVGLQIRRVRRND